MLSRRTIRFAALLAGLLHAAAALAAPEDDETRNRRWLEDIDQLAAELPTLHINAFHEISESEWLRDVAMLKEDVPDLSETELLFRLQRLVAGIGDGHTQVLWQRGNAAFSFFPLRLQWLADGLFVVEAPAGHEELAGCRLRTIAGRGIDDVYGLVRPYLSVDNEVQARRQFTQMLLYAELLETLGVLPLPPVTAPGEAKPPKQALFGFFRPNGEPFEVPLDALPSLESLVWKPGLAEEAKPIHMKYTQTAYWAQYFAPQAAPAAEPTTTQDDSTRDSNGDGDAADAAEPAAPVEPRMLYFQYNKCEQREDLPMTEFRRQLWALCDRVEIDRFVIDLRHNGGGDSRILEPFIDELAARGDLNVRGKLFVITGPRTFSSAVLNATALRQKTNAILIGEPTGGRPNHYGEVKSLQLRHSRLVVTYSTKFFREVEGDPPTIEPDVKVPVPSADYFAGIDTVLEAIKVYGRSNDPDLGEFGAGDHGQAPEFGQ